MKPTTDRQDAFVLEYLKDMNATAAAVRAGYSAKTAQWYGPRLVTKSHVAAKIAAAQQTRTERTLIDADWVLRRLHSDATADIADLYDETGSLKPVKQWPKEWRTGLVKSIDTVETEQGAVVRRVNFTDRTKLLELAGRHVGVQAFRDRDMQEGGAPTAVTVTLVKVDVTVNR